MSTLELLHNKCKNKLKELGISDKRYIERLNYEFKYIEDYDRSDYIANKLKVISSGSESKTDNKKGLLFVYLLGMSDVDPIKNNIPHVKYLGDPPDIDVDLSEEAKEIIEDLLINKHGKDNVLHVFNLSFFSPKSIIRDLCRIMNLTTNMKVVGELADYFGAEVGDGNDFESQIKRFREQYSNMSDKLREFLNDKPKFTKMLHPDDKKLNNQELLFKYATKMSGQVKQTGKHASGLVISTVPFYEFAPLKKVRGEIVLALQEGGHAKEVSAYGLLKYDFLCISELSKQNRMFKLCKELYGKDLSEELTYKCKFDDQKTIDIFDNADTLGIFQFPSVGMRKALQKVKISSFNDICIMNAMYRPGAMSQIDELSDRTNDEVLIKYEHKLIEPVLKDTYGLTVYQEQVMQIMQEVGGFSGAEADKARGVLKKLTRNKNPDVNSIEYYEYQQLLDKFKRGAAKKDLKEEQVESFIQILSDNMGYSFNKSHSIAYSCNAYIDAFFKANYPLIFYKVACDFETDKEELDKIFNDARIRGINISKFDINVNNYEFDIDEENNSLITGFKIIKGIQKKIIEGIIEERENIGKFENIVEFFTTIDKIKYTKTTIEALIMLGAFDNLYENRLSLMNMLELFQLYQDKKKLKTETKKLKFEDIFKSRKKLMEEVDVILELIENTIEKKKITAYKNRLSVIEKILALKNTNNERFTEIEKINAEFKYLELYLVNDPISFANNWYKKRGVEAVSISQREDEHDKVLCVINNCKLKTTATNKPYLNLTLTDGIDTIYVKVWENKINEELKNKGSVGIFTLAYQPDFNSYTLLDCHILED